VESVKSKMRCLNWDEVKNNVIDRVVSNVRIDLYRMWDIIDDVVLNEVYDCIIDQVQNEIS
jgi:hypothetical protein